MKTDMQTDLTSPLKQGGGAGERQRILVVTAASITVKAFLLGYLEALGRRYDVTLICADANGELLQCLPPSVCMISVDIRRAISPWQDLRALFQIRRIVRKNGFSMIHSVTPKAGLIAQLVGWWCCIDVRVHTFTGQVWVTRKGLFRRLLKAMDWVIAACATRLLADSASQRDFLVAEAVASKDKIEVLASGSISGVDVKRFRPNLTVRQKIRRELGFADDDVLALFVGRLNRDKGVLDLVTAFTQVSERLPHLALLLVGPDEEGLAPEIARLSANTPRLRILGGTPRPEDFMAAAEVFCLPSYREGFGSVVIEAAACGIPAIASAIYGLSDAVEDGRSGLLHQPRDISTIASLLERFALDREWREALGGYAQQRAQALFASDVLLEAQMVFVERLMQCAAVKGVAQ
jgi:glycosyltransferase involved in cell wall biosynthesis